MLREEVVEDEAEKTAWDLVAKDPDCHIMNKGIPCFTAFSLLLCFTDNSVLFFF